MTNSTESQCPKCGAPIPPDAPQGLCPKCVMGGVETSATVPAHPTRTPPVTVEELAPHFPDLEILEVIGVGGMGAVYKARQPKLDRLVALKILSRDLAADPAFAERFNREARVLARLSHPHIVNVFDFGTAGPHCYLLMEYVDGVNLRQAMQAGRFSPAETLALVQELCGALKFAHQEGVLHRDIKPENVLIDSRGGVKIADFGIAKLVGEDQSPQVTLTMQGAVLGSPQYMAPEQIESPGDVDQRADIYSLGVVFYELLTGELPLGRFAPPSEKSKIDTRIDEIVMRTLEKERESRFQSAEEVRTQVQAVSNSPVAPGMGGGPGRGGQEAPRKSRKPWLVAGLVVVLLLLVPAIPILLWVAAYSTQQETPVREVEVRGQVQVIWGEQEPALELNFTAPAGRVTIFEFWNPGWPENSPSDWYVVADDRPVEGVIRIGPWREGGADPESTTTVAATLDDSRGNRMKSHLFDLAGHHEFKAMETYSVFDMKNLPLGEVTGHENKEWTDTLDLSAPGLHLITLGIRTDGEFAEAISLLAWSVPVPPTDRPVDLAGGRIGPANPPDQYDHWVAGDRRARETSGDRTQPGGERMVSLDDIEGDVFARSGFLFSFRERRLFSSETLRSFEGLALGRGSSAVVRAGPGAIIDLGPQNEGAEINFIAPTWWHLHHGALRLKVAGLSPELALQIETTKGTVKTQGASFQVTGGGLLTVWEGEVEAAGIAGEDAIVVKAGNTLDMAEALSRGPEQGGSPDPEGAERSLPNASEQTEEESP